MKIYNMQNARASRKKTEVLPQSIPVLKKVAGIEDKVILSIEAKERFKLENDSIANVRRLTELALKHVDDVSKLFEDIESDAEFLKAEKMLRISELVIRVAPSVSNKKIYSRMSEFVINEL